jgi:hypothetical protein
MDFEMVWVTGTLFAIAGDDFARYIAHQSQSGG